MYIAFLFACVLIVRGSFNIYIYIMEALIFNLFNGGKIRIYIYTYTTIYIYVYIYLYVDWRQNQDARWKKKSEVMMAKFAPPSESS